jgi:predicted phosphodiesterase
MWSTHTQSDVIAEMQATLAKIESGDPATMAQLASDPTSTLAGMTPTSRQQAAIQSLSDAIKAAQAEDPPNGLPFHSRDPLTGVIQSKLGDHVLPQLQATGQGDPVTWIPAGIRGVLEHYRAKYPFQTATTASHIQIPDQCKIALLGDWGAPNIHAERLGDLAIARQADYVIHLGDIYFSGTADECHTFLERWPLRQNGLPLPGKSFALNGNHEMYSLGKPYFTLVLPAFGQEASYFTLFNTNWQIQGLDTAYEPFSISGGAADARLKVQQDWLTKSILDNPGKRNIFLTHNQPVSAHGPESLAAQPLMNEARALIQTCGPNSIYGWFFGHEHRCTIYDDSAPGSLFRARLIGNGSIAHHPELDAPAPPLADGTQYPTTPHLKANSRALDEDKLVAVSTFALLTFNNETIHIDYIDEDDRLFYAEDWSAPKTLG